MEWFLAHLSDLPPGSVYLTISGILLLCGLGLPIPEDISLIAAGYMAHLGVVDVHKMFLLSLAAVLGGDTLAFLLGRWFGRRVLAWKPAQRVFTARKQLRVRAYFRKYGSKVIFIGRFLPGLRFSIFFSAGSLRVRFAVFFIYDSLAAILSVPFLVYFAWYFGEHIDKVISWARRSEYGILALAAGALLFVIWKGWRARRKTAAKETAAPEPAPAAGPAPAAAPACPPAEAPPTSISRSDP
jgi:membrane protein DedA with SNARE-associated domain